MNDKQCNVLILGHGEMGRTMKMLLAPHHSVTIWDRNLENWTENIPLEEAARDQDFILFTLPTNPHQELAQRVMDAAPEDCMCLSIAKGLDEEGRTPAEIFQQVFAGRRRYGLIYGPMIAEELQVGRSGYAMFGCAEQADYERVKALYQHSNLYLQYTSDIKGISWAVILKNVFVPLLGAADELALGDNMRGYLLTTVLAELNAIVELMGGRQGTAFTVAGLGDLVTTATSDGSHHRQIGHDLVRGQFENIGGSGVNIRGEGIHTLSMVDKHHLFETDRFPLYCLMRDIANDPKDIGEKFSAYLVKQFNKAIP